MGTAWQELEDKLIGINSFSMPRNKAVAEARKTMADVRSGSGGKIDSVELKGPTTLLRVASSHNRVYGGQWWFDHMLLSQLEDAYSRLFWGRERQQAVRAILREGLALPFTLNKMTEVWAFELPAGQSVDCYESRAARQSLFYGLPVTSSTVNRMLIGGVKQFFIPVKNPLWVKLYGSLS